MMIPTLLALCGSFLNAATVSVPSENGLRKIGGFRCVDLRPLKNDATFDLYSIGYWSYASFGMDVWKRHGVPFWYPRESGDVMVAGPEWKRPAHEVLSAADQGGKAVAGSQAPGNGAIAYANDGDLATYWYAGDGQPSGDLRVEFKSVARVNLVRFKGWATPRHAPKDYSIGLILPDGSRKEFACVRDEKRMGDWIGFPADNVLAKGIYLDVRSTVEGQHGPVVYEFQGFGQPAASDAVPSEVTIPLNETPAEEVFCLGNVGVGFEDKDQVPLGEYVVLYADGQEEHVALASGRNVAALRYGHFVPEAEFAFGFRDPHPDDLEQTSGMYYHLDEWVPVEPKRQLMMFSHALARPGVPLTSLTFRCTHPRAAMYLAAVTLRQSGPRMNALVYNGKMVKPYPKGTRKAAPSPVETMLDKKRRLSLDGEWQFVTDPGNQGIQRGYYAPGFDVSVWARTPVPSQWYVQGFDYHGVAWYRSEFDVPASFPGSVLELQFGGVDYDARVWVNGEFLGRHIGAYASFNLDVTRAIKKGARNVLTVRVDSPVDPGFSSQKTLLKGNAMDDIAMPYGEEGCMGGIFRPVTLVGRGDIRIENVWTVSRVAPDLKSADLEVRFELDSSSVAQATVRVQCVLSEPGAGGRIFRAEQQFQVAGRTSGRVPFHIDNPRLWFPWEQGVPNLHVLKIEVCRDSELLDAHYSRVGIREVELDPKDHFISVNHHRIFCKGMLNDDIHWMSLMDRAGYRQRIQLQKDANLNIIRLTTHQSSPDMYDLCDEMGMMIWQEMPLQWSYSTSEPIHKDILSVVRDTVVQCRPHASVVGYSAWNEGGQGQFTEAVVSLMRDLDGARPMSRACGMGDWDIHIYPNILGGLYRITPLWCGIKVGFVSEVGAYGLSSLKEMKQIVGDNLFPFDSAEYYWETFNSYRYNDGPVFLDAPNAADWSTDVVRQYVLSKIEPSERWLTQFMKFMYENFRAQRFDPTTAAIHCRFDDPLPTAFLGIVNFNGQPRKAYQAVRESCQQVLPILFFDYTGVEDVRVVNDYWRQGWKGCTLHYTLKTREGKTLISLERTFDLPPDSTVKVLSREEAGDVWHLPGFFAELAVRDARGKVLSRNHYDLTKDEIGDFVTTVYPVPPTTPLDSVVMKASDAVEIRGESRRIEAEGAYSRFLLEMGGAGKKPYLKFLANVATEGDYLVRVACNSGEAMRSFQLWADGNLAAAETHPSVNMALGLNRTAYSAQGLWWIPGWRVHLTLGDHTLEFKWPDDKAAPACVIDAVCVQTSPA